MLTVYDTRSSSSSSVKKGLFKTKVRSSGSSNSTARECELDPGEGKVKFDVGGLVRTEVRASGSTLRKVLADNDFDRIVYQAMSDSSDSWSKKKSQLSPGVINVLRSMAMVGLTTAILGNSAVAELDGLPKKLAESSVRATINMSMGVAIEGVNPGEAAVNAARSTIADTIASTGAAKLGQAYHAGQLPESIHELLHGTNAYLAKKLTFASNKEANSAFIGAVAGEVAGKIYLRNADVFNNPEATADDLQDAVDKGIDLAKITAASVATLFKLDADTAASAAQTAVQENNFALVKVFINMARKWGAKFMKGGAKSVTNALRLRTEFAFREAGILNKAGKLTKKAIDGAKPMDLSEGVIKNPKVVKELTKNGSKITDWVKHKTQPAVRMPNGQRKEIHFYKNMKTHKIDYKTMDYKVKDIIKP